MRMKVEIELVEEVDVGRIVELLSKAGEVIVVEVGE